MDDGVGNCEWAKIRFRNRQDRQGVSKTKDFDAKRCENKRMVISEVAVMIFSMFLSESLSLTHFLTLHIHV